MGVNNRQRRAAKRRKRGRSRNSRPWSGPGTDWYGEQADGFEDRAAASAVVWRALEEIQADPRVARRWAELLTGTHSPVARGIVAETVDEVLGLQVATVLRFSTPLKLRQALKLVRT